MDAVIHTSPFAGSWYPGEAAQLERSLNEGFLRSQQRTDGAFPPGALGFLVPHAGMQYSGTVAAAAFRRLRAQRPERIVILGFSHRVAVDGIAIPAVAQIVTPLGPVRIDWDLARALAACPVFRFSPEARICDHSVEMQFPYLRFAVPNIPVLPLYVGRLSEDEQFTAAQRLAALLGSGVVFLISSDLTHYGRGFYYEPFPPDTQAAANLHVLDMQIMEALGSLDERFFRSTLAETRATVCGAGPLAVWLRTLAYRNGDEVFQSTIDYQNSAEITGDCTHAVGYGAAGYYPASAFELSESDRRILIASARATLERLRATRQRTPVPPDRLTAALERRAGVFVCLKQHGKLLGCVGDCAGLTPLAEAVPRLTLAAALDDPRFASILGIDGEIDLEISVLTPMKRAPSPDILEIGRHGALLECGEHRALLLPQAAAPQSWTKEEFLTALALKATLGPRDYLRPDARLFVFRAQVF